MKNREPIKLIDLLNYMGEKTKISIYGSDYTADIHSSCWIVLKTLPNRILCANVLRIGISAEHEDTIVVSIDETLCSKEE